MSILLNFLKLLNWISCFFDRKLKLGLTFSFLKDENRQRSHNIFTLRLRVSHLFFSLFFVLLSLFSGLPRRNGRVVFATLRVSVHRVLCCSLLDLQKIFRNVLVDVVRDESKQRLALFLETGLEVHKTVKYSALDLGILVLNQMHLFICSDHFTWRLLQQETHVQSQNLENGEVIFEVNNELSRLVDHAYRCLFISLWKLVRNETMDFNQNRFKCKVNML